MIICPVMTKRVLCLCLLFLPVLLPAQGNLWDDLKELAHQGPREWFDWGVNYVTAPNAKLDSNYIYQTPRLWTIGPHVDMIHTGMSLNSDIADISDKEEIRATLTNTLRSRLYTKVGASISFGSIRLSYGVEVGRKSAERGKYTSLGISARQGGIQLTYYDVSEYVDGVLKIDLEGEPVTINYTSDAPGRMKDLMISGMYIFNSTRFDYGAVYSGRVLQRRSAGSFMASARYMRGDITFDIDDIVTRVLLNENGRYVFNQYSVGGGYSYNWVPYHRDGDARGRGVRNVAVNLTLMPQLTFVNYIDMFSYSDDDPGRRTRVKGRLGLNYIGRAGVSFSWNRFILCSSVSYNRFMFRGAGSTQSYDDSKETYSVESSCLFHDMTANVQLKIRF